MRLFSTQVLERCKFYAKGSHSLTRINECPARASYCLELKRPSPQARHPTTEISAVSRVTSIWVYQFAPQHGKGNSAQPCTHILLSPESHWEKLDKECSPLAKCCLNALGCPNVRVSCGFAARKSRVRLEGVSATVQQAAKHPNICRHRCTQTQSEPGKVGISFVIRMAINKSNS